MTIPGDRVKVASATVGSGASLVLGNPPSNLYLTPTQAGFVNGATYHYVIEQGDDWEHNTGVWNLAGNTITRGTPIVSKITGTVSTNKLNLDGTGYVYFPYFQQQLAADIQPFAAGTSLVFFQAAAPTGWTKSTVHNDKAMRVVSGTTGGGAGGGSQPFSTVFGRQAVDQTSHLYYHLHNLNAGSAYFCGTTNASFNGATAGGDWGDYSSNVIPNATDIQNYAGGYGQYSHGHTIDLRVNYCDVIIGIKS